MLFRYFVQALATLPAVIAQTSSTEEEFNAACPLTGASKDQTIETLENGYQFKYLCRRNGHFGNLISTETCQTIQQCASLCAANNACKGSAFLHNVEQCQLFTDGDEITARRTGVFLRRERDPNPYNPSEESNTGSCSGIENDLRDCGASKARLQENLRQCQAGRRNCDNEMSTCNANRQQCAEDLAQCQRDEEDIQQNCSDALQNLQRDLEKCKRDKDADKASLQKCKTAEFAMKLCPKIDQNLRTYGGWQYKIWCQRWAPERGPPYKQNELGFRQCLVACSADSSCKVVNYYPTADAPCKMFPHWSKEPLAVSEDLYARQPILTAIPTREKK